MDTFFKSPEQIEALKKEKESGKKVFKFDVDSFDAPNSKNATSILHLEASDDIAWEITITGDIANGLNIYPKAGVGSEDIQITCKGDIRSYAPKTGILTATGVYEQGKLDEREQKSVEANCVLAQETKYNMVDESLSPINNMIAQTLQEFANSTPCCAELINGLLQWLDDNVASYISGILDKGMSPVTDLIGELSKEGEAIAGLISFLNGGVPTDPMKVPAWLTKLIPQLKLMVKFSTMTIAQYVKMIKQVRAIIADLAQYVIEVPTIILDRILGGGCKEIIARVAPGLVTFLETFQATFQQISDLLVPVLDLFDQIIAIIKEFVFELGGNNAFLIMIREFILDIKEKLHVAISPLAGCETLAYR